VPPLPQNRERADSAGSNQRGKMILDPHVVARGWLDLRLLKLDKRERLLGRWADDLLREAIWHDGHYALEIISAIHALDSKQEAVEEFAAGPVEDLLAYQGAAVIDAVEAMARRDPSFAFALGGVWQNAMPEQIWERVVGCRQRKGWDGITE
jgi:hypothetical protein